MTKTVFIKEGFTLHMGDGQDVVVPEGMQQLPDEVADHWFTKAHTLAGGLGAPEYAAQARTAADAAYVKAKEDMALYVPLEQLAAEAEASAEVEPTEPACTRLTGWPDVSVLTTAYEAAKAAYTPPAADAPSAAAPPAATSAPVPAASTAPATSAAAPSTSPPSDASTTQAAQTSATQGTTPPAS